MIKRGSLIGKSTTFTYDGLGRIYQVHGGNSQKLTYAYDGNRNVLSVTDALGHKTRYAYDALNRVITLTNAANGVTHFAWDKGDHVVKVTDPRGLTTNYTWDGLNLLWKQISPDTGTTTFYYDYYGRLYRKTRPDGTHLVYSYDALNRLTGVNASGTTRTYTWDSCTHGKGRLCTAATSATGVDYSYTPEGWIAARAFSITNGPVYSVGYSYNGMGQLTEVAYPDGNEALYDYSRGVVKDVRVKIGGATSYAATGVSYRPMDLAMTGWTSHNGLSNTIGYDASLRPISISVPGAEDLAFMWDAANRITRITHGLDNSQSENLGYDALGRLTSMSSSALTESYIYDADGNRLSKTIDGTKTTYTYSGSSNRLASAGGTTYGYDADGNTTTIDGHTAYTYGPFNRLVNASGEDFLIDAQGQRLEKTGAEANRYFVPGAGGALLAEHLDGAWRDYIWLNGRLVSLVKEGSIYSIHDDQTGRPLAITAPNSHTVVWATTGWPFSHGADSGTFGAPFDIGFPGQYYDYDGLWHNGFRDYDAGLGRYIESDPIGLAGGVNTYAYVGNNPISRIDPLGLAWQLVVGGGGTVIVPFFGSGANFNIGINIDGLNSSIYIQDQANLGAPTAGGAFLGAGLNLSLSHADAPTTGFDSAPYIEGDAGYLGGLGASATKDPCGGTTLTGTKGLKPDVGLGLGAFSGTTYTSTAVSPTLQSILPYLYAH